MYNSRTEMFDEIADIMALYPKGMEKAIIGTIERFGMEPVILLDKDICIKILLKDMTKEEAIEYFEYNVIGSWMGNNTPCFATLIKKK